MSRLWIRVFSAVSSFCLSLSLSHVSVALRTEGPKDLYEVIFSLELFGLISWDIDKAE